MCCSRTGVAESSLIGHAFDQPPFNLLRLNAVLAATFRAGPHSAVAGPRVLHAVFEPHLRQHREAGAPRCAARYTPLTDYLEFHRDSISNDARSACGADCNTYSHW